MKKIWLIAFIFNSLVLAGGKGFFCFASEASSDFTDKLLYGGTLKLPFVKAAYYGKGEKNTFGLLGTSQNLLKDFCITTQAGKLSVAGGLSKLNNPVISASSAFSTAQTSVSGIKISLPGSSSFSKPFSYSLQFDFKRTKSKNSSSPIVLKKGVINLVYLQSDSSPFSFADNDSAAFSSLFTFSTARKTSFSVATTLGLFSYEENVSSSWFSKSPMDNYYCEGKHYCQNVTGSVSVSNFSSSLSAAVYQSPFGSYDWSFGNENKLSVDNLTLSFSQACIPSPLFTSSQKKLSPSYQAKTSVQYNFYSVLDDEDKKSLLLTKVGAGFYFSTQKKENAYKASAGVKSSYKSFSGSLTGAFTFKQEKEEWTFIDAPVFTTGSVQLKAALSEKKIKSSVSGSFSYTPSSQTTTEKASVNLTLPKLENLSVTSSVSFTQKDGETTKRTATASLSGKIIYRKINVGYKLAADFVF